MNRVLLVDDNPMILALLEKALAPMAAVTTSRDGADALQKAASDPPDLIVTDYHMPGMDGCALLQKLKATPSTAAVPVIMAATRADISERLKTVQSSLEDFLEKPFFVADATRRIRRVLDKIGLEKTARSSKGEALFRGSLAQMGVIDLLQSLDMSRKTCALTLTLEDGDRCDMYFADGQISHAVYGGMVGDQAVYKALAWEDPKGSFQMDFAAKPPERTTTSRSTQSLLMEGLRLLDEANRDNS
jgi:CheY-like chemotaxis protein